jgi:hypothetical protein
MTLTSASMGLGNGRTGLAWFKARWGRQALKWPSCAVRTDEPVGPPSRIVRAASASPGSYLVGLNAISPPCRASSLEFGGS